MRAAKGYYTPSPSSLDCSVVEFQTDVSRAHPRQHLQAHQRRAHWISFSAWVHCWLGGRATRHHSAGETVPSYFVGEMAAGETIVEGSAQGCGRRWWKNDDVCTIKCQEEGGNAGPKESEAASVSRGCSGHRQCKQKMRSGAIHFPTLASPPCPAISGAS